MLKPHSRFIPLCLIALGLLAGPNVPSPAMAEISPAAPMQQNAPRLRVEINKNGTLWATVTGAERPLDPDAYRLTNAHGDVIPLATILPNTASRTLLIPATHLDWRLVYYLEIPALNLRALCRRDGVFRTLYSDQLLGANVSPNGKQTSFRIFAPRADRIQLYLYFNVDDTPDKAAQVIEMKPGDGGVWYSTLTGDYHGVFYDFRIFGPDDPGNAFYNTHPAQISDPYARVNVGSFGKSRVWHRTTPATPVKGGRPKMEDVVAYEIHVQDFTDRLPVKPRLKGTFTAMKTPGLKNKSGAPVGFDYLVDLGINVVHLMPVQEYLHYPEAAWAATFKNNPFAKAMGIDRANYQWGYRTTHAFAIETRYGEPDTEFGAQRVQFRDLVQAFHDRGIAVVVDVVPNHTGENMGGRHDLFNFGAIDRPYYYRTDDSLHLIGPFGNEIKTEDRPMVQRWLLDQLEAFVDEFGVDGFRIDLAGQIDEQTLRWVKAQLPEDLIIYGEPWIDASDPDVKANPDWDWYKEDAPITFFQDAARDALIGSPFRLKDKTTDRGFAGGNAAQRADAMRALANDYPEEAASPNRGINYLDIHDNWALADRFATKEWDGRKGVDSGPYKIAAGMLFTSLGPLVLQGGTEMMRSKGAAPIKESNVDMAGTTIHFKGRDDTFNVRIPNEFVWDNVGKSDGPNDYANMVAYWKGLIALRKSEAGKVFRISGPVPKDYYRWILPSDEHLLGYVVGDKVLVLVNSSATEQTFSGVSLPEGEWRLIADEKIVDPENGVEGPDASLSGGQAVDLTLPATSLKIWTRK